MLARPRTDVHRRGAVGKVLKASELVALQWVAAVPVEAIALPGGGPMLMVVVNHLGHPFEAAEEQRHIAGQVDEHVVSVLRLFLVADYHGGGTGTRILGEAVRHETAGAEGPEKLVNAHCIGVAVDVDVNVVPDAIGFFGKATGDDVLSAAGILRDHVEINARHLS